MPWSVHDAVYLLNKYWPTAHSGGNTSYWKERNKEDTSCLAKAETHGTNSQSTAKAWTVILRGNMTLQQTSTSLSIFDTKHGHLHNTTIHLLQALLYSNSSQSKIILIESTTKGFILPTLLPHANSSVQQRCWGIVSNRCESSMSRALTGSPRLSYLCATYPGATRLDLSTLFPQSTSSCWE